jgi:trimeric autotransporter adhesin
VNDCFGLLYAPPATEYKLVIFDRWGEKLYETTDITGCWDGMYKGVEAMMDSYTYVIGFRCYNGKIIMKKGVITLLR